MARILVLYGTTDGHTAKVATALGDTLRATGVDADLVEAGTREPGPQDYAGVIVAASLHAAGYQRVVRRWVRRHAAALRNKPTAFVSVCLGVLQNEPKVQEELETIRERFFTATGWRPMVTETVAGALLYTKYNWIKRWVMKRIVRKAGGDVDTTRDYEYTNWSEVRAFANRFGNIVRGGQAAEKRTA
jgi:menaquinone-dependent protoporphyrinogen oxidase